MHLADSVCGELPASVSIVSESGNDCTKVYQLQPVSGTFWDGSLIQNAECTADEDEFGGVWNNVQWATGQCHVQ